MSLHAIPGIGSQPLPARPPRSPHRLLVKSSNTGAPPIFRRSTSPVPPVPALDPSLGERGRSPMSREPAQETRRGRVLIGPELAASGASSSGTHSRFYSYHNKKRAASLGRKQLKAERHSSSPDDDYDTSQEYTFHTRPPHARPRDSVQTTTSTANSSVYPPSTAAMTRPDSPSSPSTASVATITHEPVDPLFVEGDDVSYRLKLLTKNMYYLPPAHSKPSPTELLSLSTDQATPPRPPLTKAASPTFRDLLRAATGRSPKSSPKQSPSEVAPPPMDFSRSRSQVVISPVPPSPTLDTTPARPGRVMVIRERIHDLASVANEAEHDMRQRGEERKRLDLEMTSSSSSSRARQPKMADNVDPTEVVDLPSYAFPAQASQLIGLGVDTSIGADTMAEHFAPNRSFDPEEDAWRKDLLHQAVGISFSSASSPLSQSYASNPSSATPVSVSKFTPSTPKIPANRSPAARPPPSPSALSPKSMSIGKPIIPPASSAAVATAALQGLAPSPKKPSKHAKQKQSLSKSQPPKSPRPDAPQPIFAPERAETPAMLFAPLRPPPPRKSPVSSQFSLSHQELPHPFAAAGLSHSYEPPRSIRKSLSSPMLSEAYAPLVPPPVPPLSPTLVVEDPNGLMRSFLPSRGTSDSLTSGSHYSDDEQDRSHPPRDESFSIRYTRESFQSENTMASRFSTSTSQVSHRTTAFGHRSILEMHDSPDSRSSQSSLFPFPHTRSRLSSRVTQPPEPLSITRPPSEGISISRSAPPPSSEFFDRLHAQTLALPDDSSSSSEEETAEETEAEASTIFLDPRSRAVSNTSTSGASIVTVIPIHEASPNRRNRSPNSYAYGSLDRSAAITNTPSNPSSPSGFFSQFQKRPGSSRPASVKSLGSASKRSLPTKIHIPESTFESLKHYPGGSRPRAITGESSWSAMDKHHNDVAQWTEKQTNVDESTRRLDGMMVQHMETEKDTIRRIAAASQRS